MEKTKHTPGPWHTDPAKSFYVFAHGSLADQSGVTNGPFVCNASTQANARLIAAAPELLGELVKITDAYAKAMKDAGVTHYPEALVVVRQARAAIAKARGE